MPQLWIVAGPNGAGKTTLVSRRLAGRITVVNPDDIAQSLPRKQDGRLNQRLAGEMAIKTRKYLISHGADFAIETTLTGVGPLRFMREAKDAGYKVTLVYIGVASTDVSIERVLQRVQRGGHAIPLSDLDRRYPDAMSKLKAGILLADRSYVFDNSGRRRKLLVKFDRQRFGRPKATHFVEDLPIWAVYALAGLLV